MKSSLNEEQLANIFFEIARKYNLIDDDDVRGIGFGQYEIFKLQTLGSALIHYSETEDARYLNNIFYDYCNLISAKYEFLVAIRNLFQP